MIISKAIELLALAAHAPDWVWDIDNRDAIKLGIEALKRIQECRQHPFSKTVSPLPGETIPERGVR